MPKKEDIIEVSGVVIELLPNGHYKVEFGSGHPISASVSGKFKTKSIKIGPGTKVTVQMSFLNLTQGVITEVSK